MTLFRPPPLATAGLEHPPTLVILPLLPLCIVSGTACVCIWTLSLSPLVQEDASWWESCEYIGKLDLDRCHIIGKVERQHLRLVSYATIENMA